MTKQTNKGRADNAPKKLKEGDAVVFKVNDQYSFMLKEKQAGLKAGIWIKGQINCFGDCGGIGINTNNCWLSVYPCEGDIVIRSTALEDSPDFKAEQRRAEQRKAAKELAEIEKEARRASLGRYGSSSGSSN